MDNQIYIPILKSKEGELNALRALADNISSRIIPLIEIVSDERLLTRHAKVDITSKISAFISEKDHKYKYEYNEKKKRLSIKGRMTNKEQSQLLGLNGENDYQSTIIALFNESNPTVAEYLDYVLDSILDVMGEKRIMYLDPYYLGIANPSINVYAMLIEKMMKRNLNAVLVMRIDALEKNLGVPTSTPLTELAIRIKPNELASLSRVTEFICGKLSLALSKIDLILDYDNLLESDDLQKYSIDYDLLINQNEWRKIIFSGASFPVDLTAFHAHGEYEIPRLEWRLWKAFIERHMDSKNVFYSDYTIRSPALPPSGMVNASATIRYACADFWFVLRGKSVRHDKKKYKQFHDLSENMIHDDKYAGEGHCFGDQFISDCANKLIGPGNLSNWVTVGEVHHITTVVEQLSNYPEILK